MKLAAESLLGLKHLRQTVGGYSKNIIEKQIEVPNFHVRHSNLKFKMSTFKTNNLRGISSYKIDSVSVSQGLLDGFATSQILCRPVSKVMNVP